jgi:hypothetical protein
VEQVIAGATACLNSKVAAMRGSDAGGQGAIRCYLRSCRVDRN